MTPPSNPPAPAQPAPSKHPQPAVKPRRPKWAIQGIIAILIAAAIGAAFGDTPANEPENAAPPPGTGASEAPAATGDSAADQPEPDELIVPVLGATTPVPPTGWHRTRGPDADHWLFSNGDEFILGDLDDWHSVLAAGVYGLEPFSDPDYDSLSGRLAFDSADLEASADAAMRVWMDEAIGAPTGVELSEIRHRDVVVSGFDAVLAEARISWEQNESTEDFFEDAAILVVDVNGIDAFIAIASVTEGDVAHYDDAVAALLETRIDLESAVW
jgi:hypothetical protein